MSHLLVDVARATRLAEAGGKADGLHWLARHGHAIPPTWVAPAPVVAGLVDPARRAAIRAWLTTLIEDGAAYAVRSSADVEDGLAGSYAGQLRTELDVRGVDGVLEAMGRVADSATRPEVAGYAARAGLAPGVPRTAVIVQRMVPAVVAGVAFSKNPVTGLDEVVLEAVAGTGERLVGGGVTPDRWVHRWGEWIERPTAPVLPDAVAEAIARETRAIGRARDQAVDLEWAWDGAEVRWLQVRPITGLERIRLYSDRIAREVLPGLVKPLVWSVNVPVVNRAWIELFEEVVGPTGIPPERLARQFAYRAYFDMATLGELFAALGMPRESLELLLGLPRGSEPPRFRPSASTWRHLPRMAAMGARLATYGPRVREELRVLGRAYAELESVDPAELGEAALLDRVDALMGITERAAYANIVTPVLMNLYGRLLGRRLEAAGIDPATVDPARDRVDRTAFDPRIALDELAVAAAALDPDDRAALAAGGWAALGARPGLAAFRADLDRFVERFGHLAASGNDFSVPPWREDLDGVVRLALDHPLPATDGGGGAGPADPGWDAIAPRLPSLERPWLRSLYVRAGAFRVYREAVSFRYTHGYGLFRGTFLALGERLVTRGVLDRPDDVFYLTLDEVRALVAGSGPIDARTLVAARRAEMAAAAELELPEIIYGDDFVPRPAGAAGAGRLTGLPTSRGRHRGRATLVATTADFATVTPGDVIVIPHSDVAWTPVFARAGAIVAESGGMLSHSSIVAREYGVPCVVSVTGALRRIPAGAVVTVDGYTGDVVIEPGPDRDRPADRSSQR